jgi:hypothetical protein
MKQVAGIPITSFDLTKIDSDLDTVRSEAVRGKIAEMRTYKKACDHPTGNIIMSNYT